MNPKAMIDRVRVGTNMPRGDGRLRNSSLMSFLNRGQDVLAKKLIGMDAKQFEIVNSVNIVSGTAEYDIPVRNQKITLVQRLNAAGEVTHSRLPYMPFQFKDGFGSPPTSWNDHAAIAYYIRGGKIGLDPVPAESITSGLRIYQIQHPHDMLWGDIDPTGLTTTAFKIPETAVADGGLLRAGYCRTENDYYVNARGRILTGAARGTEFTITDFNAATLLATITPAWTVADVSGCEFAILSGLDDVYHNALVGYAMREVATVQKDPALFGMGDKLWKEWETLVVSDAAPRHIDEPDCMSLPDADREE